MFKQSSIVLAALFASASAIKFQPSEIVDKFEYDPSGVALGQAFGGQPEKPQEPFRPDIGRKEVRPDVWEVVNKNVDAVPLGREHLDGPPEQNPNYSLLQVYPEYPTGLEAAPHNVDSHPLEAHGQMRKPLIPENRNGDNDCMNVEVSEYPQPDIRGPMPKNAHPDSTFSSHLHNDWTQLQLNELEYLNRNAKDIGNQMIDPSVQAFANDNVDQHNGHRPDEAPKLNPHYQHEPSYQYGHSQYN